MERGEGGLPSLPSKPRDFYVRILYRRGGFPPLLSPSPLSASEAEGNRKEGGSLAEEEKGEKGLIYGHRPLSGRRRRRCCPAALPSTPTASNTYKSHGGRLVFSALCSNRVGGGDACCCGQEEDGGKKRKRRRRRGRYLDCRRRRNTTPTPRKRPTDRPLC